MRPFEKLATCAGEWQGENILHDPSSGKLESSASTLNVIELLDGRFLRLDYTWQYQNKAQSGSMLLGRQSHAQTYSLHWIDSWHMGDQVMSCKGEAGDGKELAAQGSYSAPTGPNWGWRITITPQPDAQIMILMENITPAGEAAPAVEARYQPAR